MGGDRVERWMNLFGKGGLEQVASKAAIKVYGHRKLECLTGFLDESHARSKWCAVTAKHIIIIRFKSYMLYAGKGESEYEALYDDKNVMIVGGWKGFGKPTTTEIIDFFKFKVKEEQILEFNS